GATTAAWPFATHAQQPGLKRSGVLMSAAQTYPEETFIGLAAHAAESGSPRVGVLSIWRWWRSECDRQTAFTIATELPPPALRCSAAGRQGTRQSISAKWMRAPVRIDREPRRWGYKGPAESACEHGRRKDLGQTLGKARERSFVSFGLLGLPI